MLTDGFTECRPLLTVADRLIKCPFGNSNGPRSNINPTQLKSANRLVEPLAFFSADKIGGRDTKILKHHFARIYTFVAKFLEAFGDIKAGPFFDNEHAHAFALWLNCDVRFCEKCETRPFNRVGNPGFGSVNDVVIAITNSPCPNTLEVSACIRFS